MREAKATVRTYWNTQTLESRHASCSRFTEYVLGFLCMCVHRGGVYNSPCGHEKTINEPGNKITTNPSAIRLVLPLGSS